jgi:hypothetical protein
VLGVDHHTGEASLPKQIDDLLNEKHVTAREQRHCRVVDHDSPSAPKSAES